jgi:CheY-like chemotaxis protein
MPLIDGPTSTRLIREFEATHSPPLSPLASLHGRIPIFAASASLVEQNHDEYVSVGFDGWILKPINFRQLNSLMIGIWG